MQRDAAADGLTSAASIDKHAAAVDAACAAHAAALAACSVHHLPSLSASLTVCTLLATRGPPIDHQLTLKQLADDALGAGGPPKRTRTATRIESEVGIKVGYGVYYSVTLLYTPFPLWSGRSTDRRMGASLGWTKSCQPSTRGLTPSGQSIKPALRNR